MKRLILTYTVLLLLVILSACSARNVTGVRIDARLSHYVENFKARAAANGKALDFGRTYRLEVRLVSKLDPGIFGICERSSGTAVNPETYQLESIDNRVVSIDYVKWSTATEDAREDVVSHELGHCVLLEPHDSRLYVNNEAGYIMPVSIMYPVTVSYMPESVRESEYNRLYKQLFNKVDGLPSGVTVMNGAKRSAKTVQTLPVNDGEITKTVWEN